MLARIPAIPNEIAIVITAHETRPIAPLWSPNPRLILSASTHSNNNTATTKNTSKEITGTIQDNSSLNVGISWILSTPIKEVRSLEESNRRTIPSSTEGILSPRSFLPSSEMDAKIIRAPSSTSISH